MPEQGKHLYFIRWHRGPVKIGRANNPRERLKNLQVASPYALHLLGVLEGCGDSEFAFHDRLRASKLRGEWFKWSKLVEEIVGITLSGGDWRAALVEPPDPEREAWREQWFRDSPLYEWAA